jgi:hypothetical protein
MRGTHPMCEQRLEQWQEVDLHEVGTIALRAALRRENMNMNNAYVIDNGII